MKKIMSRKALFVLLLVAVMLMGALPVGFAATNEGMVPSENFAVPAAEETDVDISFSEDLSEVQGNIDVIDMPAVVEAAADNSQEPEGNERADNPQEPAEEESLVIASGASVSGVLWHDSNTDGMKDEQEKVIENYPVFLYQDGQLVAETVTNSDGYYCFELLSAGVYKVVVTTQTINEKEFLVPIKTIQQGTDNQFDFGETQEITLENNTVITGINAGMRADIQIAPMAAYTIDISISTVTASGTGYTYNAETGVLTLQPEQSGNTYTYTFTGTATDKKIVVLDDTTTTITLNNVTMTHSNDTPLQIGNSANVTLVLADGTTNTLTSTNAGFAGLESGDGTLTINGKGTLNVTAGAGGEDIQSNGTIIIKEGSVNTTTGEVSGNFRTGRDSWLVYYRPIFKVAVAVVDENGAPVPNATVTIPGNPQFNGGLFTYEYTAVTNEDGVAYVWLPSRKNVTFKAKHEDYDSSTGSAQGSVSSNNPDTVTITLGKPIKIKVSFDAQGGSSTDILVHTYKKTDVFKTLPTVTKDGFVFEGWYTEPTGGTKVEAGKRLPTEWPRGSEQTLYAQWRPVTHDLTITKTVSGTYADQTKAFTFTIYFKDASGTSPLASGTQFTYTSTAEPASGTLTLDGEGKATVSLQHGQSITITGITASGTVQVIETGAQGYTTSYEDSANAGTSVQSADTGTCAMTTDRQFAFTNTQAVVPPTGISAGNGGISFMLMAALIAFAGLAAGYLRRRTGVC